MISVFCDSVPAVQPGQIVVQRHLYLACIDSEAKQPVWVAFRVRRSDWDTENVLERNFSTPDDLRKFCLEQGDYEGSGYDLGHLYGLQFVSASENASEVNQLCAIAAQRPALNRGPWLRAENRIRKLSETGTVTVISGQLWLHPMAQLVNADEVHKVASHCWIFIQCETASVNEAYLFAQDQIVIDDPLSKFAVPVEELRSKVSSQWWGGAQ